MNKMLHFELFSASGASWAPPGASGVPPGAPSEAPSGPKMVLEGPKGVISDWMDKEDNIYKFNEELFEEWLDENGGDGLQDGCSYFFGGACYDLDGVGCNACSIDHESIEKAFI